MVEVDFAPDASADLARLTFNAKIDVIHKLELVEQVGLAGELKIGELAPNTSVYLLYSGNHHVVAVCDDVANPPTCSVVAIEAYALVDLARKTAFVNAAVQATGIATRVIVI